jgi:transaldolase
VIKLPATQDGIRAAATLTEDGIRCALTAVYSPAQVLLAHEVGCIWAIPYVDRAARQGAGGLDLIDSLAAVLARMHSSTRILAASLKSSQQLIEAILHGAHDVTAPLSVLVGLPEHPLTESAVEEFSQAQAQAEGVGA